MSDTHERARQLLQEMVAINSVNPTLVPGGAGEHELAHWIGDYCGRLGLSVAYSDVTDPAVGPASPPRPNVVATLHGSGSHPGDPPPRSIMLNGHLDTVSIDGMDIPPLDPRYDPPTGRVYGRGAYDMKAGLAAMLLAVQALVESDAPLRGDVVLAGVVDEEYASLGTERLVQDVRTDAAIICEPSGLSITVAHKGFAWASVDVYGTAAHGSRWQEGVDALVRAGRVLVGVEEWNARLVAGRQHPRLGPASVHASIVQGGRELSTYPDHCRIQLERRTIPGETRESVEAELRALLAEAGAHYPEGEFRAASELFFYRAPLEISPDEPVVRALAAASERVRGAPPAYGASYGWMDSAILAGAGIPTAIYGPCGEGAHSAVEWADVESIVTCARVLEAAIRDFCA